MSTSADDDRYQRARKQAEEIKGFYVHLGIYLIVNAALFTINMITNPDNLWFFWPLLGWGIGVAIHAFGFLTEYRYLGEDWEDKKARELLRKDEERHHAA